MFIKKIGNKYLITITLDEADNIQRDAKIAREKGEDTILLKCSINEAE